MLGQFDSQSALILSKQFGDSGILKSTPISSELPTNYWHYIMEVLKLKPYMLDTWDMNLILRSTTTEDNPGLEALKYFKDDGRGNNNRYQKATVYLSGYLKKWSSFSLSKTCYVRWVSNSNDYRTGCVFLTVFYESINLMRIKMRFFSVGINTKREIVGSFQEGMNSLQRELPSGAIIYPVYTCRKLCRNLLISYIAIEEVRANEWWDKEDPIALFFTPHPRLSRSFLKMKSWAWLADFDILDDKIAEDLFEDAFTAIYNARIEEGMMRVHETPGTVTFYKEDSELMPPYIVAIQYVIMLNAKQRFLCTELWIEPVFTKSAEHGDRDFESFSARMRAIDSKLLDRIFALAFCSLRDLISLRSLNAINDESLMEIEFVKTEFKLSSLFTAANISVFALPSLERCQTHTAEITLQGKIEVIQGADSNLIESNLELWASQANTNVTANSTQQLHAKELNVDDLIIEYYRGALKDMFADYRMSVEVDVKDQMLRFMQENFDFGLTTFIKKAGIFFQNGTDHVLTVLLFDDFIRGICPLIIVETQKSNARDPKSILQMSILNPLSNEITLSRDKLWDQDTEGESNIARHDVLLALRKEYLRSVFKSVYASLLMGLSFPIGSISCILGSLEPRRLTIDITDFLQMKCLWSKTGSSNPKFTNLEDVQKKLTEIVQKEFTTFQEKENVYLYYKQDIVNSGNYAVAASDPLFLNIALLHNGVLVSKYPVSFEDLVKGTTVADTFIPSSAPTAYICIDHYVAHKKLTLKNGEIIEKLHRGIVRIFDDYILKGVVYNDQLQVDEVLADYLHEMMVSASASKVLHQQTTIDDFIGDASPKSGSDLFLTRPTNFLHSSCAELFEKGFLKARLCLMPFKYSGSCFYICVRQSTYYFPFWISLALQNTTIFHIHMFSVEISATDKVRLLSELNECISVAVWETNQRYLLRELSKSNMAFEADEFDSKTLKNVSKTDEILYPFACPLQHEVFFGLHWRLAPTLVLNTILAMFQPLLIHNRTNYIVHSEKYYLKFELVGVEVGNETDNSIRGIRMLCFGVDSVGDDIKVNFVNLIQAKIDSMLQNEICNFLSRNVTTAKLTAPDISFIIPTNVTPTSDLMYLLVNELENIHLFILLLRQEFLLFLKPVLTDHIGLGVLNEYFKANYDSNCGYVEKLKNGPNELGLGDLTFVYSAIKNNHMSDLDLQIGPALLGISIVPFDSSNKIILNTQAPDLLENSYEVRLDVDYTIKVAENTEQAIQWKGYKVGIRIWSRGSPNVNPLQERILAAFQNTLVDYTIESYYRSSNFKDIARFKSNVAGDEPQPSQKGVPLPEKISTAIQKLPEILKAGAERLNPVIQHVSVATDSDISMILQGINDHIFSKQEQAYFFRSINGHVYLDDYLHERDSESNICYIMVGSTNQLYIEVESDNFISHPPLVIGSPAIKEQNDILMFPDEFSPPFPIYQKRSSFFTIVVCDGRLCISTYK